MNDNNSLAHTTWNCKYHIVFAPKYRRKILLQEYRDKKNLIMIELQGITKSFGTLQVLKGIDLILQKSWKRKFCSNH